MNEVHWSDPDFQKWEAEQLGEYHQYTVEKMYGVYEGEVLTFFRHNRPEAHYLRENASMLYTSAMVSLKDDTIDSSAEADSTDVDSDVDRLEVR